MRIARSLFSILLAGCGSSVASHSIDAAGSDSASEDSSVNSSLDSSDGNPVNEPPTPDDFGRQFNAAVCSLVVRCEPDNSPDQLGDCIQGFEQRAWYYRRLAEGVRLGVLQFDASAALRCLQEIGRTCDTTVTLLQDCRSYNIFRGHMGLGDHCSIDEECAGDARCDRGVTGSACPGICRALVPLGGTCEGPNDCSREWGQGSIHCLPWPSGSDSTLCIEERFTSPARVGEECGNRPIGQFSYANVGCAVGLSCLHPSETCQPSLVAGASCALNQDNCAEGLVCDMDPDGTPRCDQFQIVDRGGLCSGSALFRCANGLLCLQGIDPPDNLTCRPVATVEGASCDLSTPSGTSCDIGRSLHCENGRCVGPTLLPLGSPCEAIDRSLFRCGNGLLCDTAVDSCSPIPHLGESCGQILDCLDSDCVQGVCGGSIWCPSR